MGLEVTDINDSSNLKMFKNQNALPKLPVPELEVGQTPLITFIISRDCSIGLL